MIDGSGDNNGKWCYIFLGYDYHPEDKTITVNEAEAETVRLIFELYLQGYGTYTIARRLTELGKVNKKGQVKWTDSGVRGIIKNEKYKGDLLLQKTITTDPISKRRIENFGEEEQYYVRNHHEPIVSREVWEQAKEIRLSRNRQSNKMADGKREKYTKKYAFSSMCECGFCGTKLTRRTLHSSSKYETPVWYCRNAANKGKHNCPNSKSVHESILENAFLEAYKLLAGNFDDVIDSITCESGRLVITPDAERTAIAEAEAAFMEREMESLKKKFEVEKAKLHAQFVAEQGAGYATVVLLVFLCICCHLQ